MRDLKFEAYIELLRPFWVDESQTFKHPSFFVLDYHQLPLKFEAYLEIEDSIRTLNVYHFLSLVTTVCL